MSKEDQELITKLGKEAAAYQVELARDKEAKQIEDLKAAGMKFYNRRKRKWMNLKQSSTALRKI